MIKELIFRRQSPGIAVPQDLAALEAKLGVRFPPALVEFCSRWNGGFPSNVNRFYPVPPSFKEFYSEYKLGKGVYVDILFGATDQLPHCSLLKECTLIGEYSKIAIPISVDLFGDRVILRPDSPTGTVYWWDHILWEESERPYLIPIAQDLESFYNSLTSEPVEYLKNRKK
jgi:SMI1 / KNR4 family (SUKH-1)